MAPSSRSFKLGDRVEVHQPGHASSGPYFPATVIRSPVKMKANVTILYVEYGSPHPVENPLREIVNADNVRPLLRAEEVVFEAGDDVEFFFRNRWFRGVVVSMNEERLRYTVRLHDSTRSITIVCLHRNLRLHREWDNGAWNPPLPQERTKRTTPIGKDPLKVKEKSMKVKISALIKDNSLERCSKTLKNIVKEDIFKDEYVV
ncbi:hypothetical protein F8388_013515 [Cannabis sativa]|uniref:Agenet domain-containing protein n=1 Tax=Cannabis sativa TaxID=3483 RepID=A0A7J6G8V2_CANSA|nr:hypothetical protein F8388_013515 [Cannabis sativa]KAF4398387.1 hypothetical protein G4B88_025366 [Cannabis sativa]